MKVIMLGWEFPPFSKGGLGTACFGMTRALVKQDILIDFVIPKAPENAKADYVNLLPLFNKIKTTVNFINVPTLIHPYINFEEYNKKYQILTKKKSDEKEIEVYGKNLSEEVLLYAERVKEIEDNGYDLIHSHDWLTYLAGIALKKKLNKPLIIHTHATEFDRAGDFPNPFVYDIERRGFLESDRILAVSELTKRTIVEKYHIPSEKVFVVHNGIDFDNMKKRFSIEKKDRIVLFLGRITYQKGVEYFIWAAKKVLEYEKNVKFVVAGDGDMLPAMVDMVDELGLNDNFVFTGFLKGEAIDKAYQSADMYIMPSRSEPFGLTPLESIRNGTPVIISKQSGVSEVLENAIKVDFWDVEELANKVIGLLRYEQLHNTLKKHGLIELPKMSWDTPAKKIIKHYEDICAENN
jgi:glycosyltransferase involved in cell wall biosynthesis